jgi:hypothetical protein
MILLDGISVCAIVATMCFSTRLFQLHRSGQFCGWSCIHSERAFGCGRDRMVVSFISTYAQVMSSIPPVVICTL